MNTYEYDFDGSDDVHCGGERCTRVEEHADRPAELWAEGARDHEVAAAAGDDAVRRNRRHRNRSQHRLKHTHTHTQNNRVNIIHFHKLPTAFALVLSLHSQYSFNNITAYSS